MLLSKYAKVRWNSKTKKHYVNLGYQYTKMNDEFLVKVEDLTHGSRAEVKVKCDYCERLYDKRWYRYVYENKNKLIHKDACNHCKTLKTKDTVQKIYGCDNVFQLESIKEKIVQTNIQKYGVDNPSKSEIIKNKIKGTNLQKYGCESYTQTDKYKEFMKSFCLENYGTLYLPQLEVTHQKGELSPRWKGGALRNGLFRNTYQYKDWHDEVLSRDNYTCQCCGDRNGNGHNVEFHVHHIFNFADNDDKRYDVDNGICLCRDCHYEFHKMYGFRNTTNTQLDYFILNHGKKIC